ncbi:uncharacterized protein N7443_005405 [Penicillium atrosanguineum]|uniref:uncharacterized protein n=1 Tax=Penicillium atrosanguineum TaxID=1132637 RepID=UPI00238C7B86|nr:uncharacterized protein N7443_005405 [Penicillium atrosanguineum]KAJ5300403.1 hypothetical protein N7443_005405 [Penicillium atrosanguineum]
MPPDDPFAFLAEQPQSKPQHIKPAKSVKEKKSLWKEKFFNKDKTSRSTPDRQIQDFLATATAQKADPRDAAPTVSTQRIPSSQDVANVPAPAPAPAPAPVSAPQRTLPTIPPSNENYSAFNFADNNVQVKRAPTILKPRKGKGLRVGFSDRAPETIGEGGDESEVPTVEISRSLQRMRERQAAQSSQPRRLPSMRSPNPSREHLPTLRVNTSLADARNSPPLVQDPHEAEFLSTLHIDKPGSRLSFRGSPDSHSFAERVRNQMQVEEARALHNRYEDVASPTDDEDSISSPEPLPSHSPRSPRSLQDSVYETPASQHAPSVTSIVQSIRNPPSPAVHRAPVNANLSPVDPRMPPSLTPGSPAKTSAGPPVPTHEPRTRNQLASPASQISQISQISQTSQASRESPSLSQLAPLSTQTSREPSRSPQPPKFSLRNIANQVGDTAFAEFKEYIARYDSILHMSAESVKPLIETALTEWIRAAVWWFLRGKTRLEGFARSRSTAPPAYAKQAVIDLGKALWINENIVPTHYEVAKYGSMSVDAVLAVVNTTGDKEMVDLLSLHQVTMNHLRSLSMSIKRNDILSIVLRDENSPSQLDTSVWLRYPFFAPDVSAVLSGSATRSMLAGKPSKSPNMVSMMPLGDTGRNFSYGTMFVQACVSSGDDEGEQYAMPCALTIIRERSDWYVHAAISSQSQLVNVLIQSDRKQGPTWEDVDWGIRSNSMRVKLPRGFELDVMFKEEDFKTLWNIVKYTQKSEASLEPEAGETVVFENTLKVFQYMDPGTPKAFPAEALERCRIRLFERTVSITEGTGTRNAHRGFRLTVLTSPKVKTLSNVRHILGYGTPIVFGLLRGENGAPALLLKVTEDGRTRSMLMTFHEVDERTQMHSVLLGMLPREGETKTPEISLRSYAIEQPGDSGSGRTATTQLQFPAGNVSVIDQEHAYVEHGYGPTILSESLRAFIATEWGSVTDRINLGPGELKIALDVNKKTGMSLFRSAQQDLTVSLADNLVPSEMPEQVTGFLQKITAKAMVRRLDFASMEHLHAFEQAVTGFQVIYDGIASSFTISRRRMVVPIYKKWEASLARIQIVRQEKVTQILVFFADFHHGTCMNFVLKGTDHIESFNRSGKFGLRIVDAKFALPKKDDDPSSDFVCLDMPEYPIEHDDIAIAFDTETDRSSFKVALPGSVREPSRMGSLRR